MAALDKIGKSCNMFVCFIVSVGSVMRLAALAGCGGGTQIHYVIEKPYKKNEIGRMCSSSNATANQKGCRFEFLDISLTRL